VTSSLEWLPPLICLPDCGGNWDRYVEALYRHFKRDFVDTHPSFRGVRVSFMRRPMDQGKVATFWHLISEGEVESERLPDLRRCERIRWPRAIIEHPDDASIKVWENERRGDTRICLWLESEEYLVVLGKHKDYRLLLTAYLVRKEHSKRKLQREYEAYILKGSAAPD
jgi:hypothetical protein